MSQSVWGDQPTEYFYSITPEIVLDCVEELGFVCTGRCTPLNSMENRVYEVEIEPDSESEELPLPLNAPERFRVAKFYRPGRWSEEQILEEHQFLLDLKANDIPVVAPEQTPEGKTLRKVGKDGIRVAVFPKYRGKPPSELDDEQLSRIGRLLARIHNTGASKAAPHRIQISSQTYGIQNLEYLLKESILPIEIQSRYEHAVRKICELSQPWFDSAQSIRIHGDCHFGNLLWNQEGPFFLDFDDMLMGPAIQDLWLIIAGRDNDAQAQFRVLLEAYEGMRDFDRRELRLIEPLRALRFVPVSYTH